MYVCTYVVPVDWAEPLPSKKELYQIGISIEVHMCRPWSFQFDKFDASIAGWSTESGMICISYLADFVCIVQML